MAAAASSSSAPFFHRIASVPSLTVQNPTHHHHPLHLTFPHLHPPESQPLRTKPPLQIAALPLLPLPSLSSHHRLLCAAAAASEYTETDDEGEAEETEEEGDSPPPPNSSEPLESRRLYVGNLPFSMTPDQLAEIFSQAGAVEGLEIVYDRVTNQSRGFGFITMRSSEEASEAIRMFDGTQIGGRTAKVNFPEVPRGGEREMLAGPRTRRGSGFDSPYKVYAGNLSWSVTSQSLRDTFASQPGMVGAKVVYNRDTGLSRGFGFVSFASPEEAQSAVDAMNGKEVEGRPLRLNIAVGSQAAAASQASEAVESAEQLSAVES